MSSSMYTVSPASLHDLSDHSNHNHNHHQNNNNNNASSNNNYNNNNHRYQAPRRIDGQAKHPHNGPVTPESNLLSPYSSHTRSDSSSPSLNTHTPADTVSSLECYPGSDIFTSSEFADDPFVGANIEELLGNADWRHFAGQMPDHELNHTTYPISPHQTPAIPANQFFDASETAAATTTTTATTTATTITETTTATTGLQDSSLPRGFSTQQEPLFDSANSSPSDAQFTPETNRDSWSSNESPGHSVLAMAQSPRVTVSLWGKEDGALVQGVERSFATGIESPRTVRPGHSPAGDLASEQQYENSARVARDTYGGWMPNTDTGHRGLAPGERPSEEVPSINQQAVNRELEEKNREVNDWIQSSRDIVEAPDAGIDIQGPGSGFATVRDDDDNIPDCEIPLGHTTENRHQEGGTYFVPNATGPYTKTDFDLMRYLRVFEDAPTVHAIQPGDTPHAPETSQAAIERFYRQCHDNASIISKAATWGTRRRSLPSVVDMEGIISGNFLKKLSISGHSRRPSFLQRFPSLRGKQGNGGVIRKRNRSNASDLPPEESADPNRRESKDSLAPPSRSPSWRKQKSTPSLNMALVGMAQGVASIGTQHARSPSMSATTVTPSKTTFPSLSVPQLGRRPRSNSDLPRSSAAEISHPHLVGMLRQQGGPPVAQLPLQQAQPQPQMEAEDDDDDDDDGMDEADFKMDPEKPAIEASINGFKGHILRLNPSLVGTDGVTNPNAYLVDRIAYQMFGRYKQLLAMKLKHINVVRQGECASGYMCQAAGAGVRYLDNRGGDRSVDRLSTRPLSSDEEGAPVEGGINAESFPPGIPKPQPNSLPAEFECKICFTCKKFQKPSDWTKHVHEDVQPFTCTWDKCRDPKMFKRKADWVRHENEGHRHLEWWTCDVDECRHTCYRRDNFLQHLVREHKFTEPKIKTKAAIKKAGGVDRTWQKVEQCHQETSKKPIEEPCRFCGKVFPTWKKLTVHLAKHMELISLPVLGLVFEKDLDPDTIISPVQDPPPRAFPPAPTTPSIKPDPHDLSPHVPQTTAAAGVMDYHPSPNTLGFSPIPQAPMRPPYYPQTPAQQYQDMGAQAGNMILQQQFATHQQYTGLPVSTAPFTHPNSMYPTGMSVSDTEPFPSFDSLGIHEDPTGILGYQALGHPVLRNVDQYGSNQGSASPYSHSPHQGHNGPFYNA